MKPYKTFLFVVRLGLILLLTQSIQPVAAQEEANLYLSVTADRTRVKIGEEVTYTLTLTNLGQAQAGNVTFGVSLPDQLNWVSFSCMTPGGDPMHCNLDNLASGATVRATLVAAPISYYGRQERSVTAFFSTQADTPDPDSTNNHVYVKVRMVGKLPPSIH